MEKIDSSLGDKQIFDVRVTLQRGQYSGSFKTQICGSASSSYDVLNHFDHDCNYTEMEDEDGRCWFEMVLKNAKGESRIIKDQFCNIKNYIADLEIIQR